MQKASHILIVDDEERSRDALELLLSPEGYLLSFAQSGQEALVKAKAEMPDLILLDVMMPEMNGFEVCQRLRADPLLSEVPIMLLTALDDRESRLQGIESGADDYVNKPFDRLELRARIRTITRLNRYRRLLAERDRFEWVVERSDDGYVILNQTGGIHYLNARASFYLHLAKSSDVQETLEQTIFFEKVKQYYHLEPQTAWYENWLAPEKTAAQRYLVRPETSTQQPLWLQVEKFSPPNTIESGILLRLRDVTAQMNLYQQSWTFQRLVSHKLRTPLMGLAALQMAKKQLAKINDDSALELLSMAEYNVNRLNQQILDVLKYVDAPSLLHGGSLFDLTQFETVIKEVSDELSLTVNINQPPTCREIKLAVSEEALKCILEELFSNAQKFHPQHNPQIEVFLKELDRQTILLSVQDDGQHLLPTELEKVWLPYYQAEKKFTGEVKGMGLGLPTVASLIWRVGGVCRLFNRPDRPGIVVELNIPKFISPA